MKKIITILSVLLILVGCSSNAKEPDINRNPETIVYELPSIVCTVEEKEDNMLTFAGYMAYHEMQDNLNFRCDVEKAYIGDRVLVYTVDSNNKPIEKGAPYYYPIISNNKCVAYVPVHNECGVKIIKASSTNNIISYNKPYSFTQTDGYGDYLTTLTEEQLWYSDVQGTFGPQQALDYEKNSPNLNKKYAVYFLENDESDIYVITEEKTIKITNLMYDRQVEVEDDDNTRYIREQLKNQPEYEIHSLNEYKDFVPTDVHVLNNVISDLELKNEYDFLSNALNVFSKEHGLKLKIDKIPLNIWTMYVNTDLSVTLTRENSCFVVYNNKEYYGVFYVSKDLNGEYVYGMEWANGAYILNGDIWNTANSSSDNFLIIRGPHSQFNSIYNVCVTSNSVIPVASCQHPLYSYLGEYIREYIGK